jgi:hypothetical protein
MMNRFETLLFDFKFCHYKQSSTKADCEVAVNKAWQLQLDLTALQAGPAQMSLASSACLLNLRSLSQKASYDVACNI